MRRKHLALTGVVLTICVVLLALALASCGGSGSTATTTPASSSPSVTQSTGGAIDAAALYSQNCSGCHDKVPGADAKDVQKVVESGKEDMPSFKDKLSAEQIAALVTWVAAGGK
jgi:mono/diheme cytochrome c family protein